MYNIKNEVNKELLNLYLVEIYRDIYKKNINKYNTFKKDSVKPQWLDKPYFGRVISDIPSIKGFNRKLYLVSSIANSKDNTFLSGGNVTGYVVNDKVIFNTYINNYIEVSFYVLSNCLLQVLNKTHLFSYTFVPFIAIIKYYLGFINWFTYKFTPYILVINNYKFIKYLFKTTLNFVSNSKVLYRSKCNIIALVDNILLSRLWLFYNNNIKLFKDLLMISYKLYYCNKNKIKFNTKLLFYGNNTNYYSLKFFYFRDSLPNIVGVSSFTNIIVNQLSSIVTPFYKNYYINGTHDFFLNPVGSTSFLNISRLLYKVKYISLKSNSKLGSDYRSQIQVSNSGTIRFYVLGMCMYYRYRLLPGFYLKRKRNSSRVRNRLKILLRQYVHTN